MTPAPLRFGLVGVGGIGAVRARALHRSRDCALAAVYDLEPGRAAKLPGGQQHFNSPETFLESGLFDAVVICTPPDSHEPWALEALRRGKHVLVEKPMAPTVASCRNMIAVAEAANRHLAVGFNHRFFKGVKVVRDAVRQKTIGDLSWIRAYAGHTGLAEFKAAWMYDKSVMGGGTLMDNGIHVVDLVAHLLGEIEEVQAVIRNDLWNLEVEDNAFVHMRNATGGVCDLHSSWTEWKGYRFFVEAYGDHGMTGIYYAPMRSRITIVNKDGSVKSQRRAFYPFDILREKIFGWQSTVIDTFVEELSDFVACVKGQDTDVTAAQGPDGLRACAIAHAAYQSSESGQTVRLSDLTTRPV